MNKHRKPRFFTLAVPFMLAYLLTSGCGTFEVQINPPIAAQPAPSGTHAALESERDRLATAIATIQTPPATLELLATWDDLLKISMSDGLSYAISSNQQELLFIDLSTPTEFQVVGRTDPLGGDILEIILVAENTVYAQTAEQLFIVSAADPGNPEILTALPLPSSGGHALSERFLHIAGPRGVHVLDLTDPTQPEELLTYSVPGGANQIFIVGGVAYITATELGLRIFDVSSPETHIEIGAYVTGRDWFEGIFVLSGIAFATTIDGLRILDVSNPAAPLELARYPAPYASGITVEGSYAFLSWEGGIHILDVSNPESPRLVAAYEDPFGFGPIAVSGEYLYESGRVVRVYRFRPSGSG